MRSRASSTRPEGSDGFDHPYRMTIDSRYKKAAEKKFKLHKLLIAQAAVLILRALLVILMASKGEQINSTTVSSCLFAGLAVLFGTVGLRRSSPSFLYVFLFCTGAAAILCLFPFLSGQVYGKINHDLETLHTAEDFKPLVMDVLEVAQEFIGLVVQILEILVTISLLQCLSRRTS